MATTLVYSGPVLPTKLYQATVNGTTAVAIATGMQSVLMAVVCWATAPSNPTFLVYVSSVSGGTVNIKCDHDGETTLANVLVFGYL